MIKYGAEFRANLNTIVQVTVVPNPAGTGHIDLCEVRLHNCLRGSIETVLLDPKELDLLMISLQGAKRILNG